VEKTSYFRAKCVNISKTVVDIGAIGLRPKLLLMTNKELHALLIDPKIDDLG